MCVCMSLFLSVSLTVIDIDRVPPCYIHCGEVDPLVDDSVLFAQRLRQAKRDRPVKLHIIPGVRFFVTRVCVCVCVYVCVCIEWMRFSVCLCSLGGVVWCGVRVCVQVKANVVIMVMMGRGGKSKTIQTPTYTHSHTPWAGITRIHAHGRLAARSRTSHQIVDRMAS
jgi:hypothetical protein